MTQLGGHLIVKGQKKGFFSLKDIIEWRLDLYIYMDTTRWVPN
jgi:hypothetical protein